MFSLLLLIVQQILKDSGKDYTSSEAKVLINKVCVILRKSKLTTINVTGSDESLQTMMNALFGQDIVNRKDETRVSILKRISRAAENLSGPQSVLLSDNSFFHKVLKGEMDDTDKLQNNGAGIKVNPKYKTLLNLSKTLKHLSYDIGSMKRANEKMFKYSDFNKPGLSKYTLNGVGKLEFFEMAIDLFANNMTFYLPFEVNVTFDFDLLGENKGSKTGKISRRKSSIPDSPAFM